MKMKKYSGQRFVKREAVKTHGTERVLMLASVASMIDQFNMPNIRLLQDMGYEVHVACNFREGNTCDEKRIRGLVERLSQMQVVIHQWDCPRSIGSIQKCVTAYRQLWKLTGSDSFAWMHCQSPVGGALARIVAHGRGIPAVYTAHGFHFYQGAPWKNWLLYYPAEKLLAYDTEILITVNREDARFAKRHLKPRKTVFIPGVGVDIGYFQKPLAGEEGHGSLCRAYQIPEDAVLLLSAGELNERKNHRMVITALAALKRQDVYYIICGQGKLHGQLQRYADRIGAGSCIRLAGYQEQMPLFYKSADIFVFPSKQEGMPVALMEAMAAGMPCVVSDIRGNRELIDDPTMRFSPEKPEQLCSILERLLDNKQRLQAYGRYNQRKVRGYSLEAVGKRMRKIYAEMDAGRTTLQQYQQTDKACHTACGIGNSDPMVSKIACDSGNSDPIVSKTARDSSVSDAVLKTACDSSVSDAVSETACGSGNPAVSVLIATYQPDLDWLRQLFASILWQSFQDYEILLMDDGSGEAVFGRIRQLAAEIFGSKRRIRLLQSPRNEGSNHMFEKLVMLAEGEYIAFCDQDDIWEPDKLRLLVEAVRRKDARLAYSDMSVMDADGRMIANSLRGIRKGLKFVSGEGVTAGYILDNCAAACSMLVCRGTAKKAAPFYEGVYCDQWIAACAAAYGKIVFVDAPLVRYRRHGKNQTGALRGISCRRDYIQKRVLPACGLVRELQNRGIHYPYEEEIRAFVAARRQGNLADIFKYRRFSRKYAYFDLFMFCMPDFCIKKFLCLIH